MHRAMSCRSGAGLDAHEHRTLTGRDADRLPEVRRRPPAHPRRRRALLPRVGSEPAAASESRALYDPPFLVDASRAPMPDDYRERVTDLAAAGRRGDAVKLFM